MNPVRNLANGSLLLQGLAGGISAPRTSHYTSTKIIQNTGVITQSDFKVFILKLSPEGLLRLWSIYSLEVQFHLDI